MLAKITRLDKLGGFRLRVRFNDGSEGEHDFAAMLKEPAQARSNPCAMRTISRVCSSNSAHRPSRTGFDISPEWLRRG